MNITREGNDILVTDVNTKGDTYGVYLSPDDIAQINEFLEEPAYEPGIYKDEDGDFWVLTPEGDWLYQVGGQSLRKSDDGDPPYTYYTLTRLRPGMID